MTDERCAVHPRREAATACAACGRAVCRDCAVHTGVGFKCGECSGAAAATANPVARRLSGWRPGAVTVTVVVVVVILGGAAAFAIFRPSPMRDVGGGLDASAAGAGEDVHDELDVAFAGDDGLMLRGTLTVPADHSGHAPAAVIAPGFGSTDRDGVVGDPDDPVYRDLAEALADHGMVVLRYDKRGAGESDPMPEDQPMTFEHRVDDAAAAVGYLRGRGEVDADQVALVGHDESGLAALRVAGDDPNLGGLVLIGTPGRPFVEVVTEAYYDVGDDEHDEIARELEAAVDELLATGELPEIDDDLGMAIQQILPEGRDAYLAGLFSARPTEDAADVTSPVLLVRGEHDPNINHDTDVEPLREALADAAEVEVVTVPDAGHTLNLVDDEHADDMDGMGGSSGPVERADDALENVAAWLAARLEGR